MGSMEWYLGAASFNLRDVLRDENVRLQVSRFGTALTLEKPSDKRFKWMDYISIHNVTGVQLIFCGGPDTEIQPFPYLEGVSGH